MSTGQDLRISFGTLTALLQVVRASCWGNFSGALRRGGFEGAKIHLGQAGLVVKGQHDEADLIRAPPSEADDEVPGCCSVAWVTQAHWAEVEDYSIRPSVCWGHTRASEQPGH